MASERQPGATRESSALSLGSKITPASSSAGKHYPEGSKNKAEFTQSTPFSQLAEAPKTPGGSEVIGSRKSLVTKWKDDLIVPVTKESIFYHYLPIHGVICYAAMSVNVMNPALFAQTCPKRDITNFLLFGSVGGIGLYVYNRPHLHNIDDLRRIGYSAFGAVMFTFGSVLMWAVMRSVLPGNVCVSSTFGLLSAAGLIKCGSSYCNAVDAQIRS